MAPGAGRHSNQGVCRTKVGIFAVRHSPMSHDSKGCGYGEVGQMLLESKVPGVGI
jgi:hypothetical protein